MASAPFGIAPVRPCDDLCVAHYPIDDLLELLDLERRPGGVFVGVSHEVSYTRIFGGQVAAQALVAAGRTVDPERHVHSLHAYFLRPGDPRAPVEFHVERMRDGRGFSVRRVLARQHGKVTFTMSASFHVPEATTIAHTTIAPAVPGPETLPSLRELMEPHVAHLPPILVEITPPVDIRPVRGLGEQLVAWWGDAYPDHPTQADVEGGYPGEDVVWFRSDGPMPDDPLLHVCVATYLSDATLLDAVQRRHGLSAGRVRSRWPASTTRCGSTARTGRTSGPCTSRRRRRPTGASASRAAGCSTPRAV